MPISEVYNMDCMEYMKSVPDKFFELAVVAHLTDWIRKVHMGEAN